MKIQDLRVGNWYMSVKFGVPVQCTLEDFYDLCANAEGATAHPPINQMFEPIKLTRERAQSLGFEGKEDDYSFNGYYISFDCDNPVWLGVDGCCMQDTVKDGIQYVHELQDLYRDLKDEELITNGNL